jgi:hypothetical protein
MEHLHFYLQVAKVCGPLNTAVARFLPGQELRQCLLDLVKSSNMQSAFVLTCVGSVTKASLRMACGSKVQHFLCMMGRGGGGGTFVMEFYIELLTRRKRPRYIIYGCWVSVIMGENNTHQTCECVVSHQTITA